MSEFDKLNPLPEEPASEDTPAERAIPVAEPVPVADPVPVAEINHADEAPTETPAEATVESTVESTVEATVEATADSTPEVTAKPAVEAPAAPTPAEPPKTAYRWSYADETSHSAKTRGKGIVVYAAIMAGIFLLSFGLLLAVLLLDDSAGYHGLLRPGISETEQEDEAVVGVEQAKHSVVVIEVITENGGGTGTGIIMTSDGYIATNHHVIEGATRIKVTFYDGSVMEAELVGSSEMDDLAVIKVSAMGLPAATFAYSEDCYVGQTVYAIGTPAGPDFGWTTTKGIISYKNREVKIYNDDDGTLEKKLRLLQTDAMVNPGNSGGPLVNTKGEVVEILEAIIEFGNADNINSSLHHKRPMLGITGVYVDAGEYYLPNETGVKRLTEEELAQYDRDQLLHPEVSGVYVMGFADGMDAATKMEAGDIVTAAQGEEITSMNVLSAIINEYYAGDTVTLTVYRDGRYIPVDIVLSPQPDTKN